MVSTNAVNATLRNLQASIQNLENQVRQLAKANSEQPHGSFPSNLKPTQGSNLRLLLCEVVEKLRFSPKVGWLWRKANTLWEMQLLKMRLLLRIATTRSRNLNNPNHHRYGQINPISHTQRDWRRIRRMPNSRNYGIFSSNSTLICQLWKPYLKCPGTLNS